MEHRQDRINKGNGRGINRENNRGNGERYVHETHRWGQLNRGNGRGVNREITREITREIAGIG